MALFRSPTAKGVQRLLDAAQAGLEPGDGRALLGHVDWAWVSAARAPSSRDVSWASCRRRRCAPSPFTRLEVRRTEDRSER